MSGPSCETCGHFRESPLLNDNIGECYDPFKAIYYKYGDRVNDEPIVHDDMTCCNYTVPPKEGKNESKEGKEPDNSTG